MHATFATVTDVIQSAQGSFHHATESIFKQFIDDVEVNMADDTTAQFAAGFEFGMTGRVTD